MKKIIALILAVLMLATMMAGCGGGGNTSTTAAAASTTKAAGGAAATTAAAPSGVPADKAFGGVAPEDQIDYINYEGAVPIIKEGQEITLSFGVELESGFPNNVTDNWFWKYVENELNIIPDVAQILDMEKMNLLFASKQVPDIMMHINLTTTQVATYGKQEGLLLNYAPYLENYMPSLKAFYDANPNCAPNYTVSAEGDMYAQSRVLNPTTCVGWYIHLGWLQALDMELPTSIAELTDTLITFRDTDPAVFGVDRIVPINGNYSDDWGNPMGILAESFGYLVRPYFQTWDVAAGYEACLHIDDQGNEDYGLPVLDDLFYDYMQISNDWYNEDLYSPDYFTGDAAQLVAENKAGYTGVEATHEGMGKNDVPDTPGSEYKNEYLLMPALDSHVRTNPNTANYPVYGNSGYYMSGISEHPEVLCRFFDLFWNPEYDYVVKMGPIEGVHDTYGLKGYIAGDNPLTENKESYYIEGEENANTYKNNNYVPTYMDQTLQTWDFSYRFACAVAQASGKDPAELNIVLGSKEVDDARNAENYAKDPETYCESKYREWNFSIRTMYSESGMDQPLRYVYRDQDTSNTIADINAVCSPYIQEQVALFITGRRPIDDVAKFQEELIAMGLQEYDDILSGEYEVFKANMG
ncbi:MAG: hypothetical protein E7463_10400 [Ruminococcaceae bacterium]|nr:hypothetical protein [Oscillospiraceae bacterium]